MVSKINFRLIAVWLLFTFAIVVLLELTAKWTLSAVYNRQFDSELIQTGKFGETDGLKSNAVGTVWGKTFKTDFRGGRSTNGCIEKKSKKTRLYIGDSVTEGVGVDDSSHFVYIISNRDTSNCYINLSLIGYSVSDYYKVLSHTILNDSSIAEVTVVFTLNDVYGRTSASSLPSMARQNWIGAANGFLQEKCSLYKLIKLYFYKNSDSYYRYDESFYVKGGKYFQSSMQTLLDCNHLCRSASVPFNVVLVPYQSQLHSGKNEPQLLVSEFCREQQIPCFNLTPCLKNDEPSSLYLFADEIHFSEKGHLKIADCLAKSIIP